MGRAMARYAGNPPENYVISDGNRGYTPAYVELTSYAMAAQGFDSLSYYTLGYPHECNIFGYPEILKAIKRVSYNLGAVEDKLLEAEVLPADVAIGWSMTTDVWDMAEPLEVTFGPGNCIYPQERQNLYLLLRHLQTPVDILSEEDVIEGRLKNYKVYVLAGDHLSCQAAKILKEWVAAGGCLVSVAGGGLLDEYDRPQDTLKEVFGIKEARLDKKAQALRNKLELLHAHPLDEIIFTGKATLPVYGYRQSFEAGSGQVIGSYGNGQAAAVLNSYGQGKALIIGALPGTAYLAGAFPRKPYGRGGGDLSSYIFPDYQKGVRELIGTLLPSACIKASVSISREPMVEVNLLRDKKNANRYYAALVNFSGKPIKNLAVEIDSRALGGIARVEGAFGPVSQAPDKDKDTLTVILNLDKFEVLTLEGIIK